MKRYIIMLLFFSTVIFSETKLENLKLLEILPDETTGGYDIILNTKNKDKKRLYFDGNFILYFKVYPSIFVQDFTPINMIYNPRLKTFSVTKEETLEFFNLENLNYHYMGIFLPLRNGEKFLYGRVSMNFAGMRELILELNFINKDNVLVKKIFYKEDFDKFYSLLDTFKSKDETEGYYSVSAFNEEITMITTNKIIHKKVSYLLPDELEMYEKILDLFKNEIPKEYFEYREKWTEYTSFERNRFYRNNNLLEEK